MPHNIETRSTKKKSENKNYVTIDDKNVEIKPIEYVQQVPKQSSPKKLIILLNNIQNIDKPVECVKNNLKGCPSQESLQSAESRTESIMKKLNIDHVLRIVPEFDGNSSELDRFLACCDIINDPLSKADSKLFLKILPAKLKGKAYDIHKYKNFDNFSELKTEFIIQFSINKSIESLQIELINIKQQKFENIRDFSIRVEKLLSDLNNVTTRNISDTNTKPIIELNSKRAFIDGLCEPIRLTVKASRPTDLVQAVSIASEEELSNKKSFKYVSHKIIKCNSCGRFGHTFNNCYVKNQNNFLTKSSIPSSSNETTSQNQQNLFCVYCNNRGHNIKDCRKKKFADSRTINRAQQSYADRVDIPKTGILRNPENLEGHEQSSITAVRVLDL